MLQQRARTSQSGPLLAHPATLQAALASLTRETTVNRNDVDHDTHLPRWAYVTLATAAAAIGLACSAVTAKFFILGLERTEGDALARDALILAGVLMVVVELAAFGLAALLPRDRLKALRTRLILTGIALVGFEVVTLYTVQSALVSGSDAQQRSASSRIAHLEATIQQNRNVASALVATGLKNGESQFAPSRSEGARALREAAQLEQRNVELSAELAKLQASQAPTLTSTLGETGMVWYSVTRSVLVVVMGLVMFASAGALLRAGRTPPPATTPSQSPVATPPTPSFANGIEAAPAGTQHSFPAASRWLAAGVPLAAIHATALAAPSGFVVTAPVATVTRQAAATVPQPPETPVTPEAQSSHTPQPKRVTVEVGSKRDSGVGPLDGHRYRRVVKAVRSGKLIPSVRAIQALEGGGTSTVRGYLQQMERDGVIVRSGRGYKKA